MPWIHNVKNTDLIIGIDDNDSMNLLRLFNEPAGREYLVNEVGVSGDLVSQLDLLGISSIANVLMAIKFAKYYDLTHDDLVLTVFTDSAQLYQSRLQEARKERGEYCTQHAIRDFSQHVKAIKTDSMMELNYVDRKRVHNLKYFTWIEQQMFDLNELNRQWYDYDSYWGATQRLTPKIDELITKFNDRIGLL